MTRPTVLLLFTTLPFAAGAAPRLETLTVNGKGPEVEVVVAVSRPKAGSQSCDASLDLGDGRVRPLEFGMANQRGVRHTYQKAGTYRVSVKGAGKNPCEGSRDATLTVAGPPAKKEAAKKETPKKETKKKAAKKEKAPEGASSKKP